MRNALSDSVFPQETCENWLMQALNRIDRAILGSLQDDGRLSYEQLAERVNLSPSAVLRRVRRRVVVQDMAHYSRFIMDTLLKHPSVQDCKTSFVLDRVKSTTAVPL